MENLGLSDYGLEMNKNSGMHSILDGVAETLKHKKKIINLSVGNPAIIPKIDKLWKKYSREVIASKEFGEIVGR